MLVECASPWCPINEWEGIVHEVSALVVASDLEPPSTRNCEVWTTVLVLLLLVLVLVLFLVVVTFASVFHNRVIVAPRGAHKSC